MTPIEGGYHCDYCNDKVLDISSLSENDLAKWRSENSSACVIINETKNDSSKTTLSHFALALMVVGGGAFFNFADAQLEENVSKIESELSIPQDPSLGILKVNLENQYGSRTWGNAWVELPNGKELEMYEKSEGEFYVEIPAYCKGKTLHVYAEHLDKKKHVSTVMYHVGEDVEVTLRFKSHKRYRRMVAGYF